MNLIKLIPVLTIGISFQLSAQIQHYAPIEDPMNVQTFKLSNGLTVMLSENHEAATITGVIAVKAGGKNDPKHATGMAHYLEHMLFKGTETMGTWDYEKEKIYLDSITRLYEILGKTRDEAKRSSLQQQINLVSVEAGKYAIPNEMDRMLSEIGGKNVNAFTTNDFTAYFNEFPSNKLEQWLDIYDHRFEKPVFRLFQSELETVYEEKNISMDSPFNTIFETFNQNFWKKHPYGQQPIIGLTEHLKNPSLEEMYKYFETYYVANNMVLVLSGDFNSNEVIQKIKTYFGDWRTGVVPTFPTYEEADFKGKEKLEIKATPIKAIVRGYRTPKNTDQDIAGIHVLTQMLSNEEGSGMLDALTNNGKVTYAAVLPLEYNDYSALGMLCIPKIIGQSFNEADNLLDEILNQLRKGEFTEEQVIGAKLSLQKAWQRKLESNMERSLLMVESFTQNISWNDYLLIQNQLDKIDKKEIQRLVNKYLGENYLSIYSKRGSGKKDKLKKPPFEPVVPLDGKESIFAQNWRKHTSPQIKPSFLDFDSIVEAVQLDKYVTLSSVKNPLNELFQVQYEWKIGTSNDSILYYLPNYLNKIGSNGKSADSWKNQFSILGSSYMFKSEQNKFILELEGFDNQLEATLKLTKEFIENLEFSDDFVKAVANEVKGNRKLEQEDNNTVLEALQEFSLYGNQSTFLRELSSENLDKLTSTDYLNAWKNVFAREVEIEYYGLQKGKMIENAFATTLEKITPTLPGHIEKARKRNSITENNVIFLSDKKALQSLFLCVKPGTALKANQLPDIEAFNLYFGADMSSLVFQEIREFRSLAYSTSANYRPAKQLNESSLFIGFVGCQADKTPEALKVMYQLIDSMPIKKEREDALRSSLISNAKTDKVSARNYFDYMEIAKKYEFSEDPNKAKLAYFSDWSFDQLVQFYQENIQKQPVQLIILGNPKKIGKKTLDSYGKKQLVSKKDIFQN